MSFSLLKVVAETVWMTESGYPAIIKEVGPSKIDGMVVSPSGIISCSWNEIGDNLIGKPKFFNLKHSPDLISHKYAILKNNTLIGSDPDKASADKTAALNNADYVCKYSEITSLVNI